MTTKLTVITRKPAIFAAVLIATNVLLTLGNGHLNAQERPRAGSDAVTLAFAGADIEAVARTMAAITGKQVVVDPRVKGTISLSTDRPVAPAAAWNQFLATLRLQGYTVVEAAGLYKVVPETDAKLQAGTVSTGAVPGPGNQIVTQIFRLNHETANNLVPVLRPLISPNNTINVNPGNNALIITDYADNLQRMARIIAAMDVSNATDVEIIPLRHAIATDLVPLVTRLIDSGSAPAAGQGQTDTSFKTTLVAEPRSNTLILRAANPARAALVRSLVERLDQPAAGHGASGNIHVVYLKNADATKLAATLRAALAGESRGGTTASSAAPAAATTGGAAASAAASAVTTGGQIQADAATNALIISAPEPQYRQLRAVIDQLDARRAQVFVESLIAEVNADKAAEFGIQWQNAIGQKGDGTVGLLGTNFTNGGANIISLATQGASGGASLASGANVAGFRQINGVYVLGFLARFLQENGAGNVLSTPNLLTLDNEEAKIVIGQNLPFVTGQYTSNNSNTGSVNPFQTIERKDVGLTLRVRPQISENGTVKLVIYQETSAVKAGTEKDSNGPTTTKRTIESTVLVEDGAVVVLGGLLQDEFSANEQKIPGIGDVPLLGNLFRSEVRSRSKTNLMVFLRPVVMRDAQATDALSLSRYELMRGHQRDSRPEDRLALPVSEVPVMPPARPAPTPTPAR